jgi:hypothetical protein
MAELGSSAEKGTDSDDDSASGMINYIDRLTNVAEKLSTTDDAVISNRAIKVQAAGLLQSNPDPVAAKMGTDFLISILNSD